MILKIDDATAAALVLEERGPMQEPLGTVLDGPIGTRGRRLWTSPDGRVWTTVWECDAGRFHTVFDGEGEVIRIIEGRLTCLADDGTTTELSPGDTMTFPPGWRGEWRVHARLRKIACCFRLV